MKPAAARISARSGSVIRRSYVLQNCSPWREDIRDSGGRTTLLYNTLVAVSYTHLRAHETGACL
eukprot:2244968-Pyramimonas_sp.AAC.1